MSLGALNKQIKTEDWSRVAQWAPSFPYPRRLPNRTLLDLHAHDQVYVAVPVGFAVGVRSEENHRFRGEFVHQNTEVGQKRVDNTAHGICGVPKHRLVYPAGVGSCLNSVHN